MLTTDLLFITNTDHSAICLKNLSVNLFARIFFDIHQVYLEMKAGIDKPTKFSLRKERIKTVTTFTLCWVLVYDLQQEVSESFCCIKYMISARCPCPHVDTPRAASEFERRDVHTF